MIESHKNGQTLIEVLVSLSVILLTLAAIAISVTSSVSNSVFIKNQTQASKYAQDGMEFIKYIRNNDSKTFFDNYVSAGTSKTMCMDGNRNLTAPTGTCVVNVDNEYIREITFTSGSSFNCSGQIQVSVVVKWKSSKCNEADRFCHKSVLDSCFKAQDGGGL